MYLDKTTQSKICAMLPQVRRIIGKRDPRNADDLTQEVMIKLLRCEPSRLQLDSRTWLFRVIANVMRDHLRKLGRENKYLNRTLTININGAVCEGGSEEPAIYTPAAPELDTMEQYLIAKVREALRCLPKEQRQAIVLNVAGYDYREIASLTGEKLGTVKTRVHYGRKKLAAMLA